ncbi:MAG: RNA polymerase sigma factor [Spirochaetota bacterium]|nr:RNA polymerase sigma factor [Spirochaetota bacterium]
MNDETFTNIVEQTKSIVLSAIEKYLDKNNSHAIDDVVQETYFRAYKSLIKLQFKAESQTSTWLYTIAKNESLRMNQKVRRDNLKKEKAKSNFLELDNKHEELAELSNIKEVVDSLPIKYQNVLSLYIEGYKEKDIAKALFIPLGTVKSRFFKAKLLLKKLLQKE